ncbi:MAG: hypothetical protein ACXAC5_03845 [Promethearchaeota archaeon]|jgi:hypothetical protein
MSHSHCKECNKKHPIGEGKCSKCGCCLYKNAKQIPDDMYPLFKCKKCGQVNFWD